MNYKSVLSCGEDGNKKQGLQQEDESFAFSYVFALFLHCEYQARFYGKSVEGPPFVRGH